MVLFLIALFVSTLGAGGIEYFVAALGSDPGLAA